jgi:nitrile hydratase
MTDNADTPHRGYHDLGGLPGGAIDMSEHVLAPWEKRVDTLRNILGDDKRRVMRSDVLRHAIENMGRAEYESYTYYQKWITAIRSVVIDRQLLSADEIDRRKAEIRTRLGIAESAK